MNEELDLPEKIEGYYVPTPEEEQAGLERFRKKMWPEGYEAVLRNNQPPNVSPPSPKIVARPPAGSFSPNGIYTAPDFNRQDYIYAMNEYARSTNYSGYGRIETHRVYFMESNDQLNFFHPDFLRVFDEFLFGYQYEKLIIVQGMSVPTNYQATPHSIGMAIDVLARSTDERNHIMNTAWAVGIPNIVQAGDGTTDIHIHLDICPKSKFLYDGIYYEGPWSLSRFT